MITAVLASHPWDEGIHPSITQPLRNLARNDEFNTCPVYLNQALKMLGPQYSSSHFFGFSSPALIPSSPSYLLLISLYVARCWLTWV